ncbi:MAG: rRNA maturation RNase YbeY [Patescibacteria group bacterium]
MAQLVVSFTNQTNFTVNKKSLIQSLELILLRLNHLGRVNIELLLVGDEKIKLLNKKFRDMDKVTDVLSFSSNEPPAQDFYGSIVISANTANRQAKQAGINPQSEINALAGHGLLHLLGYNHS